MIPSCYANAPHPTSHPHHTATALFSTAAAPHASLSLSHTLSPHTTPLTVLIPPHFRGAVTRSCKKKGRPCWISALPPLFLWFGILWWLMFFFLCWLRLFVPKDGVEVKAWSSFHQYIILVLAVSFKFHVMRENIPYFKIKNPEIIWNDWNMSIILWSWVMTRSLGYYVHVGCLGKSKRITDEYFPNNKPVLKKIENNANND